MEWSLISLAICIIIVQDAQLENQKRITKWARLHRGSQNYKYINIAGSIAHLLALRASHVIAGAISSGINLGNNLR
jgi:hypothetical protein